MNRIEALESENAELKQENAELKQENAELKARLQPDPSSPSGSIPPYEKARKKGRKKKPGRKKGHPGSRRKTPENIDRHEEIALTQCPICEATDLIPLNEPTSSRVVEDLTAPRAEA
ncbi:MAG: hypothetical protein GY854_22510, partial [Deltaproteobacteria bacterium]|nr:hypothetical protein [Deltaproteobacteria bacterium]